MICNFFTRSEPEEILDSWPAGCRCHVHARSTMQEVSCNVAIEVIDVTSTALCNRESITSTSRNGYMTVFCLSPLSTTNLPSIFRLSQYMYQSKFQVQKNNTVNENTTIYPSVSPFTLYDDFLSEASSVCSNCQNVM